VVSTWSVSLSSRSYTVKPAHTSLRTRPTPELLLRGSDPNPLGRSHAISSTLWIESVGRCRVRWAERLNLPHVLALGALPGPRRIDQSFIRGRLAVVMVHYGTLTVGVLEVRLRWKAISPISQGSSVMADPLFPEVADALDVHEVRVLMRGLVRRESTSATFCRSGIRHVGVGRSNRTRTTRAWRGKNPASAASSGVEKRAVAIIGDGTRRAARRNVAFDGSDSLAEASQHQPCIRSPVRSVVLSGRLRRGGTSVLRSSRTVEDPQPFLGSELHLRPVTICQASAYTASCSRGSGRK
jgi:hypothetical protein